MSLNLNCGGRWLPSEVWWCRLRWAARQPRTQLDVWLCCALCRLTWTTSCPTTRRATPWRHVCMIVASRIIRCPPWRGQSRKTSRPSPSQPRWIQASKWFVASRCCSLIKLNLSIAVTSRASPKPNGFGWGTYRVLGALSAPLASVFIFLTLNLFGASSQTAIS